MYSSHSNDVKIHEKKEQNRLEQINYFLIFPFR